MLGAILTLGAVSDSTSGAALLAIYSAGLGVPLLLAAAFTGRALRHQAKLRRLSRPLHAGAGVVMAVAMVTAHLTIFSLWLLKALPVLGRLG